MFHNKFGILSVRFLFCGSITVHVDIKSPVVEDIFYSGDTGPAAYIAHHADNVELFMDNAAAEKVIRG